MFHANLIRSDPICPGGIKTSHTEIWLHWKNNGYQWHRQHNLSRDPYSAYSLHLGPVLFMVAKSELRCPTRYLHINIHSKLGRHLVLWTNYIYSQYQFSISYLLSRLSVAIEGDLSMKFRTILKLNKLVRKAGFFGNPLLMATNLSYGIDWLATAEARAFI